MNGLQLFAHSCGGSAGMVEVTEPASLLAPDVASLGNHDATKCMSIALWCQDSLFPNTERVNDFETGGVRV